MPSRHQILLSQEQQGDPFLGFLAPALGALGKVAFSGIKKLFGKKVSTALVGSAGSKLATLKGIAGPVAIGGLGTVAGRLLSSRILGVDSRVPKPGMRGRLERFLPGGETGFLPARRRMNPTNIHALRRATRRLAAFHKVSTKAERELRKFAPRARSRSVPSHEHARPVAAVSVR